MPTLLCVLRVKSCKRLGIAGNTKYWRPGTRDRVGEKDRVSSGCMSCKLYIQMLALYLNKNPRVSSEESGTREEVSRHKHVPHYVSNRDISVFGCSLTYVLYFLP